ncbi:MAG TPA: helix-turn-helix domain-containing protein [Chthoniobacter sp.]|jgi:AraC-like DNA-binding protein
MPLFLQTADYFAHPQLPVALFRREHGIACLPHSHPFHEIVFVLRGRAEHVIDDFTHSFSAGDVLLIHAGQVHHYREVQDLALHCVLLLPTYLDALSDALGGSPEIEESLFQEFQGTYDGHFALGKRNFVAAMALVESIESEWVNAKPLRSARILEFLRDLLRLVASARLAARDHRWSVRRIAHFESAEQRLAPAVRHLESQFTESVRLEDLADLTKLTSRTLLRQFGRVTGRSPVTYLHDVRMHHAMLKLRKTSQPIIDVALDVGFNDLSFFNRKFKFLAGVPPTAWRRQRAHEW